MRTARSQASGRAVPIEVKRAPRPGRRHRRGGRTGLWRNFLRPCPIPAGSNVNEPAERDARPQRAKESTMKYMLLIYADEAIILNDKTREQRVSPAYATYMEAMQKAGVIVGGDRLQPTASATTVRARNGKPQVLDGPYAETKEQLGGF